MSSVKKFYKEKAVNKFLDDLWFDHQWDAIDSFFSQNAIIESPVRKSFGPEGKRNVWKIWTRAFPKRKSIIDNVYYVGESEIIVKWSSVCIHDGEFLGFMPSGKSIEYGGVCGFKLDDNLQVVQYYSYSNILEIIAQTANISETRELSQKSDSDIKSILKSTSKINLTETELLVMVLWVSHLSSKDSAKKLGSSFRTVEKHRSNILRKLQLNNVRQISDLLRAEGKLEFVNYLYGERLEKLFQ